MSKPALVIMAAGMGSRYGGLKQIDHVDEEGHIIIDFSIYDAIRAGFDKIVFIINKGIEKDFKESIGKRIEAVANVQYVFQETDKLPAGFSVPEGRVKPWGTGHAILCCKDVIDGPFAVINADDFYGQEAFSMIYQELEKMGDQGKGHYAMVGYVLSNTLTENGYVSRGVCEVDEKGYLQGIVERVRIEKQDGKVVYSEDGGNSWEDIAADSIVSMNLWGFSRDLMDNLDDSFTAFLKNEAPANPLKSEFFIPSVVENLLKEGRADVKVLKTNDKWFGVTYKEDKEAVVKAIRALKDKGVYPDRLWERS